MIVVEGPDGAGKTTLVKRLSEELGLEVMPRAVSKDAESLTKIDDYITAELAKGFGARLYDRFALISSPFYGSLPDPTFRGEMWNIDWLRMAHWKLNRINPVIIVCLPPLEEVLKNVHTGNDNRVVQQHIGAIYINYLNYLASQYNNTSVMHWDYTEPNYPRLQGLLAWAQGRGSQQERTH